MGVAERKERHKEDLKREILDAAKTLFAEKGLEATSIRAIADKIEYSPATIYLYYKDKNEIVHALHREGFKLLVGHFEVLNHINHPFERLKGMGRAYIQFALQNPDIYTLLFNMEEPLKHVANCFEEWDEGDRAFDILLQTVKECQTVGYFTGFNAEQMSFMIWSMMHGLCTLRLTGHLEHVGAAKFSDLNLDQLMSSTFETFVTVAEKLKT
ncbi:MAG: TetR/AcrR family transcriptional regulator [Cyclobacteriaceae bacterium]|nr:TetR/AcrR family transcriptional regulator [Cytophagales bacterium]MBX2900103.1 TetR/AcrR family transcriptional regulator [Cyclobacteriaceae bacterium]